MSTHPPTPTFSINPHHTLHCSTTTTQPPAFKSFRRSPHSKRCYHSTTTAVEAPPSLRVVPKLFKIFGCSASRSEFTSGFTPADGGMEDMSNQQLMDHGNQMMDETDQAIDRAKKLFVYDFGVVSWDAKSSNNLTYAMECLPLKAIHPVVHDTVDVGTEAAAALKAQTEQMSRIVNELDSIHFSIKKASQLVKEIGRQVATDRCIMALLFFIVIGVIAIIIVKIVNPNNKDIRDIPGLAPPAPTRKLLWRCD
ncbi:hypothetical protein BUALT_Bualt05G0079000 [Buddleja alternifolia]|uniref:t-SNARE coiled-coil homology domain-containing protein n=1 Tax=Buddleja alternifolia TaxID=168488 RepID=A0AAV6XTW8_9LAMI|nr:hypothetical protein BUALT_Bualt05G0079000 [Buddleja alternifolia]